MYADPRHIRTKRVNLSFNEPEHKLIEAVCELTGEQPAAYLRSLILESLKDRFHSSDSGQNTRELRAAH